MSINRNIIPLAQFIAHHAPAISRKQLTRTMQAWEAAGTLNGIAERMPITQQWLISDSRALLRLIAARKQKPGRAAKGESK